MKEEKQGFIQWVKVHKKELIIAGISAAAIIGVIIGIKKERHCLNYGSLYKIR